MASIMATALSWFDDGLDYTIQGLSGHHTPAEMPAHTHRRREPTTGTHTALTYFPLRNDGRSKYESWQSS